MRIWRIANAHDYHFAAAAVLGKWEPTKDTTVCPECTAGSAVRVKPMIIEWEPDSDVVGDFVWGLYGVAIAERLFRALQQRFKGFEPGPVEFWQNPKLNRPTRITKRTKPRIWLPYTGPPLYELWVRHKVHLDLEQSTVRLRKTCGTCGRNYYDDWGFETRDWEWDPVRGEVREWRVPRVPGQGLFVHQADLEGADIFSAFEADWNLCTDRAKEFIEREGFTNVTFFEMGEVI